MAVTLKEVAQASGVNLTTASLVINNHPNAGKFSQATRRKILDTVDRLGYQPNAAARALVMQRTNNIGFVIPDNIEGKWKNPFYSALLNGICQGAIKENYNVLTFYCNMEEVDKFVFPQGIAGRNVDGLVLCRDINPDIIQKFEQLNIPFAKIGSIIGEGKTYAAYGPDMVKGLLMGLEYLSLNRHTRIAVMGTNNPHVKANHAKVSELIADSHLRGKLDIQYLYTKDYCCDYHSAGDFMDDYFGLPMAQRPTALLTNPQTCLAVIRKMRDYNLQCPKDLSIISIVDDDVFDYITPGITSLYFDNEKIGAYAAEKLIENIRSKGQIPLKNKMDFPVTLKIRESCKTLSNEE